jgi:hypothetical protein
MNLSLVGLLIILIPATAIIDYFAFRGQFKKELGEPMKWNYFVVPCALEIGMFILGYIMGSGACP